MKMTENKNQKFRDQLYKNKYDQKSNSSIRRSSEESNNPTKSYVTVAEYNNLSNEVSTLLSEIDEYSAKIEPLEKKIHLQEEQTNEKIRIMETILSQLQNVITPDSQKEIDRIKEELQIEQNLNHTLKLNLQSLQKILEQ
eukprot:c13097_g1_i1.p1 GENE.c13097_g1_i1~~c13097_g1_i1.p1  ORF type:complete len:140 (+),score=32.25 c13097_g1_i1:38-457(+)